MSDASAAWAMIKEADFPRGGSLAERLRFALHYAILAPLQRILLIATRAGYSASYLNQPVEVPSLRKRLRALVSADNFPQLLLRMGRGRPVASHTPRRPLEEVLW